MRHDELPRNPRQLAPIDVLIYLRHLPKPAQATPKINMLALRDAWMDCHFRLHVAGQEGVYYEQ